MRFLIASPMRLILIVSSCLLFVIIVPLILAQPSDRQSEMPLAPDVRQVSTATPVPDDDDDTPATTPDPEATAEATPEATLEATPEVTPEITPEATAEVTPGGDDDDVTITIIIEGPVEAININIITIYDIDITLAPDNPVLTVIQIGDIVRIEGDTEDLDGTIIIIAVTVIIINVDVNEDTGEVWRDDSSCANPPPDWAPAHGWRRRCGGGGGNPQPGGDDGMGMGMGMGDDDDDD